MHSKVAPIFSRAGDRHFPVPAGWKVSKSASTVLVIEPEQSAFVQLKLSPAAAPGVAADEFVKNSDATVLSRGNKRVHGHDAVVLTSGVQTENGELRVVSYFIGKQTTVYVFHGITSTADFDKFENPLKSVMEGFQNVTDPAVLNKQPRRLGIVQTKQSGTMRAALRAAGASDAMVDELALLNGMSPDDRVEKGYWLKVVKE